MKFTLFFVLLCVFQVSALTLYSQGNISLDMKNTPVRLVIKEIEKQSHISFFYNDTLHELDTKISVFANNKPVFEVLTSSLDPIGMTFQKIKENFVVIVPKTLVTIHETIAQPITVSGKVVDKEGNSIIGVTVVIKGTTSGTVTDINGKFSLKAPSEDAILVFSYIGMKSQEVPLAGRTELNITMESDAVNLQTTVVIGYGTQIKKNLSSSISIVDAEKLTSTQAPSFEGSLQGRAAGVEVTSSSALAGASVKVRIRGTSSISANSEPLYVIDGMPVESGSISSSQPGSELGNYSLQTAASTNVLASINPSDIESVEVLKDAAASAIYGSRGANGVVLITTKKGKAGKTQINATLYSGFSEITNQRKLLNSDQFIGLAKEAWVNGGMNIDNFWKKDPGLLVDGLTQQQAENTNTNWTDQVLQIGQVQNYNVSVSGGNEKNIFYFSANYSNQETILKGNKYKSYGTRLNFEHQISKMFRLGGNMMLNHVDNHQVPTDWAGGIGAVGDVLPIWPVYKDDGTYFNIIKNPVAQINLRTIHLTSNQILGNWFLKVNLIKGLIFQTDFGTNMLFNDDFHYVDGRLLTTGRTTSATVIGNNISWNFKNSLNYKIKINGHNFDILAATDAQQSKTKSNSMFGETYFNTAMQYPSDAKTQSASYLETGYSFLSFIGRINYDFKGRYLFSSSLRADASSRFAPDNRWGYFPTASLGYILSEESYFAPLKKVFNLMKLRASYGIVGNAEIGDYAYYSTYTVSRYDGNTGITLQNLGDDQLGWEKTSQLDLGLTFEAFKGRISGEFDYYSKLTSDLLLPFPVSQMTGVFTITKNVGTLSNKGVDIMLTTLNITKAKFTWETSFNFNHNKNLVVDLSNELGEGIIIPAGIGAFTVDKGYPVGVNEIVEWAGVDKATGEDTYIDAEGKKLLYSQVITDYGTFDNFYLKNKKPMGNPWPKYTGGMDNRFTYKNWYMNILVNYSVGKDFLLGEQAQYVAAFGAQKINPPDYVLGRWQAPGDEASVSRLNLQGVYWPSTSEFLHRVDYIRVKDLTLGYRFDLKKSSVFKGINCYIKLTNLLTFSNAPDYFWDPEFTGVIQSNVAGNLQNGGGYRSSPQAKTYIIGLSLDL